MSFNKNFPITRSNRFNEVDDINDNDDNHDDDHYNDNDQYNRFHSFNEGYHRQSNTNNNSRNNNNNNSNNYQNNYNSNRQNNGIPYYNYNTQWHENYENHQEKSISSITSTAMAIATAGIGIKDLKIKENSRKSKNILPPPSYQELNYQQQKKNRLYPYNDNNDIDNDDKTDDINWKNNSFFGNLNRLNDGIDRPTNRNNHSNSIRKDIQKRNDQLQQQQQLKYELLKPKLFGTFSLQKNIIDPSIETDNNSPNIISKSTVNNKKCKTLIIDMKNSNSSSYKNTAKPSTRTTIRNGIKSKQNYNNSINPKIHHQHHQLYNRNYNDEYIDDNNDLNEDDDDDDNNDNDDNIKNIIDVRTNMRAFFIEFLEGVSAHGFAYLAKGGLHILERVLWILFIAGAIFSVSSLGQRTWERFQTSPMVITMDRNKLVWNTSFPSLTVCPYKRIDEGKVEDYMESRSKYFQNEDDRDMFREFVNNLAHASYDNIEKLVINKTFDIKSDKYRDLLHELKWNFSPEMSSGTPVKMHIYETITELGVCHAVNSMIARYNSYEYWKYNNWAKLDHGDKVTVHPLDGEIYAQIINLSTAYDVYFHGAMEVPDISKQKYIFPETDYTTVELTALEIFTAEEARDFSIKQRKCRFHYEADEMMTSPIYSFGLCRTECRMKLALKICKCVPHFYRNQVRSGKILPVCGIDGFACLAKIKKEIISLKSDNMKIECDCQPNCDDSNFFVQSYKSRIWFLGANLQWGISSYPKMQLRREILFTFADVLVYIGGLAGFFLGCSILSFTEFIYFFTVRLFKRLTIH